MIITMQLKDFQYDFPADLIARYPLANRSDSRLLSLNGQTGAVDHKKFKDLPSLLTPKDLIVFNNTRVIPARLLGHKETGGKIEVLVERILDHQRIVGLLRSSKTPKIGSFIHLNNTRFEILARHQDLYELRCVEDKPVLEVIEELGQIPLPPYFQRDAEASDLDRYQTVYAEHKGSVAAPTAGLHFDDAMFAKLKAEGIETAYLTLHVGAGTFMPVRVENIHEHKMHSEYIEVSAGLCEKIKQTKANGGRVIAVGTTTLRSLETASLSGEIKPFSGETSIFIYPGFKFNCVDALFTNFHAPASSLLMLVSAFAGYTHIMNAYQSAIKEKYRFFSYGDAMFLSRAQ
jgi:S-adenosylmethionine:tRNA ribosyltransferase-isomerase